ncbi:hypothetical protein ACS0TY_016156 [Phlomoides rotata]
MEAEGSEMWLLEAMDNLWFHQIILFPKTPFQSPNFSLQNSFSEISNYQVSSAASVTTCCTQVDSSSEESDDHHVDKEIRRLRLSHRVSRKTRYNSFSPAISAKNQLRKLEKTMSLGDLELEELKGFMDLGFIFKRENLSRKTVRLIPGLKRLDNIKYDDDDEEDDIIRPYLSEAWDVQRPDYCALMNVRIGGDFCASDMKENLKCWARSVALAVQYQEFWGSWVYVDWRVQM